MLARNYFWFTRWFFFWFFLLKLVFYLSWHVQCNPDLLDQRLFHAKRANEPNCCLWAFRILGKCTSSGDLFGHCQVDPQSSQLGSVSLTKAHEVPIEMRRPVKVYEKEGINEIIDKIGEWSQMIIEIEVDVIFSLFPRCTKINKWTTK